MIEFNDGPFRAALQLALREFEVAAKADAVKLAEDIKARARRKVRVGTEPSGRKHLRDEIAVEAMVEHGGFAIDVGVINPDAGHEHGLFVEFGTSKMAARPFMRPAIAESIAALPPTVEA